MDLDVERLLGAVERDSVVPEARRTDCSRGCSCPQIRDDSGGTYGMP